MGAWEIHIHRRAESVLERLPRDVFKRIDKAISSLADDPKPRGSRKLRGRQNRYRIRVGDWRIVYAIEKEELIVLILEIATRGSVYRGI